MTERFIKEPIIVKKDGSFIQDEIRTTLYLPHADTHAAPPELLLPGIGQDGRIPPHILENTSGIAVADALPYRQLRPDDLEHTTTSLRTLAWQYSIAAIRAYQRFYQNDAAPDILAESQQAIGASSAESKAPHLFGDMLYIRPIGMGVDQLGDTPGERLKTFGKRAVKAAIQGPHLDFYNAYSGYRILRPFGRGVLNQFRAGLSESIVPTLERRVPERHKKGKRTILMASTDDRLTPAEEIREAQEKINRKFGTNILELIEKSNSWHVSLATKPGLDDLAFALHYLRNPKEKTSDSMVSY